MKYFLELKTIRALLSAENLAGVKLRTDNCGGPLLRAEK